MKQPFKNVDDDGADQVERVDLFDEGWIDLRSSSFSSSAMGYAGQVSLTCKGCALRLPVPF